MKLKPFIAIILCVLFVTAIGVWMRRAASSPSKVEKVNAPLPKRSPAAANAQPKLLAPALDAVREQPASPAIQTIVDQQSQYGERMGSIKNVAGKLSLSDEAALEAFLLQPNADDSGQLERVLKNELLDELCHLNPPPKWLAETLAEMYRDASQNVILRDYAVQHLGSLYEQMEIAGWSDPDAKSFIQNVLVEAISESDSSIAGTALLALEHLSEGRSEFNREKIGDWAAQLAADNRVSELTRIAAVQVCGELNIQRTISILTQIAKTGESIPLKIAAIGSLGTLGDSQSAPFLTDLVNGADARLKFPAQHALDQIQRKKRTLANNQKS